MFRALKELKERMRLNRLRQLWTQCDMFDASVQTDRSTGEPDCGFIHPARPVHPTTRSPRPVAPPSAARPLSSTNRSGKRIVRVPRTHRDDVPFIALLVNAHAEYNATLFKGQLEQVQIRISRRMKNRLGHYMAAGNGLAAEIAISHKHIGRDPWEDVLHTLVHEMVHQWQDENGHSLDHGQSFRRKAREVGISARATRPATPSATSNAQPRMAARAMHRRRS